MKKLQIVTFAKYAFYAFLIILAGSCSNPVDESEELITKSGKLNANVVSDPQLKSLAEDWLRWVASFPVSDIPWEDQTGEQQMKNQPFASGIFLLAGGGGMGFNRTVNIPAGYTQVFIPMANLFTWYAACDPSTVPPDDVSGEEWLGYVSYWLNNPVTMKCRLNNQNMIKDNFRYYRAQTSAITVDTNTRWGVEWGYGECGSDGENFDAVFLGDGYWILVNLPVNNCTLEIQGGINFYQHGGKGGVFKNSVFYSIIRG